MVDARLLTPLPGNEDNLFTCWKDIESAWSERCESSRRRWIFRGQPDERWTFRSSLERAIWLYSELRDVGPQKPNDFEGRAQRLAYESEVAELQRQSLIKGLPRHFQGREMPEYVSAVELEVGLIRRFQRQCHHYVQDTPLEHEHMEWLALMRHYGAPTRMLDWSWSFFVALFFAIHRTSDTSAVWALDLDAISSTVPVETQELLLKDPNAREPETFNEVFKKGQNGVVNVSPFRLNERLVIQQGTFLVPRNIASPFDENLSAALQQLPPWSFLKFRISGRRDARREILQRLHRMNISAATLFPGLDGFAESLEQLFAFPDVIRSAATVAR